MIEFTQQICSTAQLQLCGKVLFRGVPRGGSRTAATSKMERFLIIVNGFEPLTIITKRSILDVVAVLDPPLVSAVCEKSLSKKFPGNCCYTLQQALHHLVIKKLRHFVIAKAVSYCYDILSDHVIKLSLLSEDQFFPK